MFTRGSSLVCRPGRAVDPSGRLSLSMRRNAAKLLVHLIPVFALGSAGSVLAHHSFTHFDPARLVLIEGRIVKWSYASPHSWLYVEALDKNGQMQEWGFEGAGPIRAARQGVTGITYKKGERVRLVMSPLRDGRPAGALCFVVQENGTITQPNDGTCEVAEAIDRWKSKGWLDSARHLDTHPVAD